jgi:hypothetical protein
MKVKGRRTGFQAQQIMEAWQETPAYMMAAQKKKTDIREPHGDDTKVEQPIRTGAEHPDTHGQSTPHSILTAARRRNMGTAAKSRMLAMPRNDLRPGRRQQKSRHWAGFFLIHCSLQSKVLSGGRYRVRTCDPYHVKVVLYR